MQPVGRGLLQDGEDRARSPHPREISKQHGYACYAPRLEHCTEDFYRSGFVPPPSTLAAAVFRAPLSSDPIAMQIESPLCPELQSLRIHSLTLGPLQSAPLQLPSFLPRQHVVIGAPGPPQRQERIVCHRDITRQPHVYMPKSLITLRIQGWSQRPRDNAVCCHLSCRIQRRRQETTQH